MNEARDGLELIGAAEQLHLLNEAVARFEREFERLGPSTSATHSRPSRSRTTRTVFGDLDERYFEMDVSALQLAYIRSPTSTSSQRAGSSLLVAGFDFHHPTFAPVWKSR